MPNISYFQRILWSLSNFIHFFKCWNPKRWIIFSWFDFPSILIICSWFAGLVEPPSLDCHVPNLSPVESLQRQLYSILQESKFSDLISDQEELIFQDNQKTPFETDLGAILLKPPTAVENDTKTTSVAVKDGDSVLDDAPIKSAYP